MFWYGVVFDGVQIFSRSQDLPDGFRRLLGNGLGQSYFGENNVMMDFSEIILDDPMIRTMNRAA